MINTNINSYAAMAKKSKKFITVKIPVDNIQTGRVMVHFKNGVFVSSVPVNTGEITVTTRTLSELVERELLLIRNGIKNAMQQSEELRQAVSEEIAAGKLDGLFGSDGLFISSRSEAGE